MCLMGMQLVDMCSLSLAYLNIATILHNRRRDELDTVLEDVPYQQQKW